MKPQSKKPESFADLVRNVGSAPKGERIGPEPWPRLIGDGHWTDDGGTQWHIRGRRDEPPRRVLRRLLKRPDLRVLHSYGPYPAEVPGAERQALLERVERYFAGEAPPHRTFWLAEFRDENGHIMLVIEEAC